MATDVEELKTAVIEWGNDVCILASEMIQEQVRGVLPYGVNNEDDPLNRASSEPHLKDTEEFEIVESETPEWRASWAYTSDHASYTDEGTDPWSKTMEEGFMVFYWPQVGKVVWAKHVDHPPTQGTRWWSDNVTIESWNIVLNEAAEEVEVQ